MATTIYFNGRVTAIPGSYSEVDASGLAKIGLGATGIVACIGEAEGGAPATAIRVTNPGKVSRTFRDGDLLEAGLMLFDPSKDAQIPGGAQEVVFWKTNPATQSTLTLDDAGGSDSIDFASVDYGEFTTKINLDVSDGTTGGKSLTIEFNGQVETFDDVGAEAPIILDYAGDAALTTLASFDRSLGLSATTTGTITGQADYVGGFTFTGDDSAFTQPGAAGVATVTSDDIGDTFAVIVYGLDNLNAPVSESITIGGPAGVVTFSKVHGVVFPQTALGNVTITIGAPVWVGSDTDGVVSLTSDLEFALAGALTVVAAGASTDVLTIFGLDSTATPAAEAITLNGTTPVVSTTLWSSIAVIAVGDVAAATTVAALGDVWQEGEAVTIVSANAADVQTATVYGLAVGGAPQSEDVVLTGITPVTTTANFAAVYGVLLSSAATGNLVITGTPAGSDPTITAFNLLAGQTSVGLYVLSPALAAQAAAVEWTNAPGGVGLVIGVNGSGSAAIEQIDLSSTGTTTTVWNLVEAFALPFGAAPQSPDISVNTIDLNPSSYPNLSDWTGLFDTLAEWSYTLNESAPQSYAVTQLDEFTGQAVTSLEVTGVQQAVIDAINNGSALLTAEASAGSTSGPANTLGPVFLSGGVEGVTTFAEWQTALDSLRDLRINTIVVLTADEAVHAAVVSHCAYMAGPGRSERDCLLGADTTESLADLKARALALNTRHARLFGQDIVRFNTLGSRETFPPYFTACIAAGMQAGSPVGTSLTFKYLNVLDVKGDDTTFTIKDDGNELIQSGLCMVEKVPNVGFRFLRNNTTWLIDNNLAYVEASTNEAVNFAVFELRSALEAIVGQRGFAGTVNAALGVSVGILGELIAVGAITSYRNLTIELDADVMTVDLEIAPIVPVNFVKTTLHLVSASFSASA